MVKDYVIWRDKATEYEVCNESGGANYKALAIEQIALVVTDALQTPWTEKRITKALLVSAIGDDIADLLMQFLHSQLEIIGKELNREFDIDEAIETRHATHAKLSSFVGAIKEQWVRKGEKMTWQQD